MRLLRIRSLRPVRFLFFIFLALSGLPAQARSQTFLGTVSELGDGDRLTIRLETEVREGILAFVVTFDDEFEDWIAKAQIAIVQVSAGTAQARVLGPQQDSPIAVGDRVAIYEAVVETGISLRVRPSVLRLIAGETAELTAELVDEQGKTLQSIMARWMSSDETVVSVNEVGRVVGLEAGRVTLSAASSNGLVGAITVDVLEPSFSVQDSLITFLGTGGDTIRIVLTSAPGMTVSPSSFQWASSDNAIASVNGQGVVSPQGAGFIRVTVEGYGQRLVVPVRVYERPATVFFEPAEEVINLVRGEVIEPSATVVLVGGTRLEDMYPEILAMDSVLLAGGKGEPIVALREGDAHLRVRAAGEIKDWTVRIHPPGVKIDLDTRVLSLGGDLQLSAYSTNLAGRRLGNAMGVRWSSRNPEVVEVQGNRATARATGKARLVASFGPGGDTLDVFVLGDLLATVQSGGEREIKTISLTTRQVLPLSGSGLKGWSPALSPDGGSIVFVSTGEGRFPRLYLADAAGGNVRRLAEDFQGPLGANNPLYQEHDPTWSHDGSLILFASNHQGNYEIYSIRPDGTDLRRLSSNGAVERRPATARDGPRIAYERWLGVDRPSIVISSLDGSDKIHLHGNAQSNQLGSYQGKPTLMTSGTEALMIQRGVRASANEPNQKTLARVDLSPVTSPQFRTRLLDFDANHELIYALSPDEKYIAYTEHSRLEAGGSTVTIIALDPAGRVVSTMNMGSGEVVKDLTWATNHTAVIGGQENDR